MERFDKERLRIAISLMIDIRDTDQHLSESTQADMAYSLTNFVIDATDKFIKGQIEHGGELQNRDLAKEIKQEQIDLFWYTEAQNWK